MKMKTILLSAMTVMLQSLIFAQTNPLIKYLPANASMIMSFNPVKMGKKVPGEAFRQSMMYREMIKKDDGEIKAFLSDPSISGIDFSYDLMLVVTTDPSGKSSGTSVHLFGALKNEALFSLAVKKISKGEDAVQTYGTDKIMMNENNGSGMAWNSEIFVLNMGGNSKWRNEIYNSTDDSIIVTLADTLGSIVDTLRQKEMDKKLETAQRNMLKTQRESFFNLLSRKPDNAITTDAHFINLINTPGDIKMWSAGTSGSMFEKIPQLAMFSKLKMFSGKSKTSVINFENGKIVAQSHNYVDDQVAAVYKKYPPAGLNTDLSRRLPKGKLLVLMNTSFNAEMGKELMQKNGMQEMMDSLKGSLPFDFSLAQGVFKNNMMLAVVKSDEVSQADSITEKMGGIQVVLAMPIANKAKFEELKTKARQAFDSLKGSEMGEKMFKGFNPAVKNNDELFVLSLSPETAKTFLNNPGNGTVPEWLQAYSQHPMVMSINMKELFGMLMGKMSKGKSGASEKMMLDMFDQVIVYGGDFENESLSTTMEFRFTDQNSNALKQLFDMVNLLADGNKKVITDESMNRMSTDSTVTIEEVVQEEKKIVPPPPPPAKPKKVIPKKTTSPANKPTAPKVKS
jgi:hypothetical protein